MQIETEEQVYMHIKQNKKRVNIDRERQTNGRTDRRKDRLLKWYKKSQ